MPGVPIEDGSETYSIAGFYIFLPNSDTVIPLNI
jgi:hypothetical protein